MTRLGPYSQSSCRLVVKSSNLRTELSGVWVHGRVRDVILTVSHFQKDPKVTAGPMNTTAEIFSDCFGNSINALPIKCELYYDFNDPMGEQDFAIFVPCSDKISRSPARAIDIATISSEANSLSGIAIGFGFNSPPTAAENGHPDNSVTHCGCINCWYGSGNAVRQKLQKNDAVPDPRVLSAGWRTITVGKWTQLQGQRQICHTATGWCGISGAGMYTQDMQGQVRLVALCKFFNVLCAFFLCLVS